MEERDDYTFMTIKDAILAVNQKVNLIGVVVEWGFPKQSKGSDSFCSLKILDESRSTPGISVNIFAENMEKLPRVVSVGDIIQLSHVMVSLRFRPREQDKKFVGGLRNWLSNFQLGEDSRNIPLLREIKKGERMDLACKILHICEVAEGEWMAFVWDGTDTPPNHIHNKLEDEMDKQLPLQLEPLPLSRDILHSFPTVGSILRVIIDQVNKKHVLHLLNTGKWMIFLNVLCQVNAGLWYGVLTHFTRLRYMPSEDPLILERQRPFEKRLSIQYGRMPFWSFPWISRITEVDYNDDKPPFVTLMDVLNHQKVTAKFRCTIRVVAALPCRAEHVRSPCGNYRMRLTLEDPTARIHAFVYGEDGEKFFDGYPSVEVLKRKLNKLLVVAISDDGKEIKDAPRNPPWVQCCLKSYYLDKNDKWGSRHYRIFDTKLVG
ncbi:hypothetical protein LWI29_021346 [Acer saccharum]|uniref:Telomeric single stranded DNA binding POT1/Cdc13 domain-containing protein n=1 Tax=Acer saccharum TaxID=4024 RepID=A0AA39VJ67_ACESA|nr:hypothetical protein LWI29_021346 [Acer saccharum]KAK1564982.1 hypothetical protein Q3G72_016238 [Acer saccharum]